MVKTMKKRFFWIIVIGMLLSVFETILPDIKAETKKAEFYINGYAAKVEYDSRMWRVVEGPYFTLLQIKNESKIAAVSGIRFVSNLGLEDYVAAFSEQLLMESIDGKVLKSTVNGYPSLTISKINHNQVTTFTMMIVKDGPGYYVLTFGCVKELYPKYINEALKVFRTFQILEPSTEQIIDDPEILELLKSLDESAGYDDEAVIQNLSSDGSELIGYWRHHKNPQFARLYTEDGRFIENLNEDGSDYAGGYWRYDPDRRVIIYFYVTVIKDGQEVVDQLKYKTLNFAVRNFDKKMMYGYYIENLTVERLVKD